MRVCKYLNQRVRRIGEKNGKLLNGASKTKQNKKKKHMKRLIFITQFKLLLAFTGCRKVLGKVPGRSVGPYLNLKLLVTFISKK